MEETRFILNAGQRHSCHRLLHWGIALVALLPCALLSHAQMVQEIKILAAPNDKLDYLAPVVAPNARILEFHDDLGFLLVGQREPKKDGSLLLFRVDAKGLPSSDPVVLPLPKPPGLAAGNNYPTGLVFHPRLRLLYVWQDIDGITPPLDDVVHKTFEHLLIYDLTRPAPELIYRGCQGPQYHFGQSLGGLNFDAKATRLFIPNMKDKDSVMVGYLPLDDKGLPLPEDKEKQKIENASWVSTWPIGTSFFPVSDNVVLVGGSYGPITWDLQDRRSRFNGFMLYPYPNYKFYMTGHPTLSVFYCLISGQPLMYWFEHADGYITMMPKRGIFEGATVYSKPVVIEKKNQLAIGSDNRVLLLNLDSRGHVLPKRVQTAVDNPEVSALAYSERWDLLYVPVEKKK